MELYHRAGSDEECPEVVNVISFRALKVVCEELELPETNYTDEDRVWIEKLPGSKTMLAVGQEPVG